jgi:hypothetical protein
MTLQKLSHQRKKQLKLLMIEKAKERLKEDAARKAQVKKEVLAERVTPLPNLNSMSDNEIKEFLREVHNLIGKSDEGRYDMMIKVMKADREIDELNQRIDDFRGKFKRPPLRKVKLSADQMLKALLGNKHKVTMDLRGNLRSTKDAPDVEPGKRRKSVFIDKVDANQMDNLRQKEATIQEDDE